MLELSTGLQLLNEGHTITPHYIFIIALTVCTRKYYVSHLVFN